MALFHELFATLVTVWALLSYFSNLWQLLPKSLDIRRFKIKKGGILAIYPLFDSYLLTQRLPCLYLNYPFKYIMFHIFCDSIFIASLIQHPIQLQFIVFYICKSAMFIKFKYDPAQLAFALSGRSEIATSPLHPYSLLIWNVKDTYIYVDMWCWFPFRIF